MIKDNNHNDKFNYRKTKKLDFSDGLVDFCTLAAQVKAKMKDRLLRRAIKA